jgi:hypothetical protein
MRVMDLGETFFVAVVIGFVLLTFYGGYFLPINYFIDRRKSVSLPINILIGVALAIYLYLRINFDITLLIEFLSNGYFLNLLSLSLLVITAAVTWLLARRKKYVLAFFTFQTIQGIAAIPILRNVDHFFLQ